MGIIVAKFKRKKTTYEVLETIDKEIKNIEEYRRNTEQTHKRIVGRFIVISVIVYLVTAFTFYFYYFPATFYDRLFYIIPLILAPVIILTVKRTLSIYYKWKIARKQNKLTSLRDEKKKMLEKVMETETYKVAKTILEKFAPETVSRKSTPLVSPSEFSTPIKPPINTPSVTAMTGGLRQRALPVPNQQLVPAMMTPARTLPAVPPPSTVVKSTLRVVPRQPQPPGISGTPLPMPRTILPRERSVFDKMVDYLVGDGPQNRFALICQNCFSHNGMAFREEFEYISFRCCYCYHFNPARKKKPAPPKLELDLKSPKLQNLSDTSESEKNSPSDTESENEATLPLQPVEIQQVDNTLEETNQPETEEASIQEMPMDVDVTPTKVEKILENVEPVNEPKEMAYEPKEMANEHKETANEPKETPSEVKEELNVEENIEDASDIVKD